MAWDFEELNKKFEKEKNKEKPDEFEKFGRSERKKGINLLGEHQKKNIFDELTAWVKKNAFFGKIFTKISFGMAVIFGIMIFSLLGGLFVKIFWNWLMPDLFGLAMITYWQGWGISILSTMLFKGVSTK